MFPQQKMNVIFRSLLSVAILAASIRTMTSLGTLQQDIPALLSELENPQTEWKAASQLQKRGAPAAAALVSRLRQDGFRDRDHGNHSPTMRTLEKIGEPSIPEIERALTPAVLQSADPEDVRFLGTAARVLGAIGGSPAVQALVRVGVSARDVEAREIAFDALVTPRLRFEPKRPNRPWEACLQHEAPYACPFDTEASRAATRLVPLLGDIRERMSREPNDRVRVAEAQVLAIWGSGPVKTAGEVELLSLASRPDVFYVQETAIRTLGLLGVESARGVIRTATAGNTNGVKHARAEALARLRDDGHVPLFVELMNLPTASLRPYSEEVFLRQAAIRFAGQSQNTAFVPVLIDLLTDRTWNGSTTTTTVGGQRVETRHTVGEDALAALHALTFETFGPDPQPWRSWWESNLNRDWRTLLTRFVESVLPKLPTAEPWVMNEWVSRIADADDPAVLPFLKAYFRHPQVDIYRVGPNSSSGGGGTPRALILLLNLASQGSADARQLLYECGEINPYPLAIECPRVVAVFDRERAIRGLREPRDPSYKYWAAHELVQLGDPQSIPMLIQGLESSEISSRSLAFRDLQYYTQEDIPYDPNASAVARKAGADAWRRWWETVSSNFTVKVRAARIDMDCCRV
jgi:HEAT repeat protein